MKQRRAAAPYAKALFALAKKRNQTELVAREFGFSKLTSDFLALVAAHGRADHLQAIAPYWRESPTMRVSRGRWPLESPGPTASVSSITRLGKCSTTSNTTAT